MQTTVSNIIKAVNIMYKYLTDLYMRVFNMNVCHLHVNVSYTLWNSQSCHFLHSRFLLWVKSWTTLVKDYTDNYDKPKSWQNVSDLFWCSNLARQTSRPVLTSTLTEVCSTVQKLLTVKYTRACLNGVYLKLSLKVN